MYEIPINILSMICQLETMKDNLDYAFQKFQNCKFD